MKYYWLLFSDNDVISLDDYVFNTEASVSLLSSDVFDIFRRHPFALSKVDPQPYEFPADIVEVYLEKGDAEEHIGSGTAVQLDHLLHRDLPGTRAGFLPGPEREDGKWHPGHLGGGGGAGMGSGGWLPG